MFPIRDENPGFLTPWVTFGIIGLNVLAWTFVQGLGAEVPVARSICTLGAIPAQFTDALPPGTRVPIGPQLACVLGGDGVWYTAVTSMFLHGGWFHVISNMWFLWIFGNNVEDAMGHARFAVFYLTCGLAAVAVQVMSNPASGVPMVGASGAIGGVMGAYVLLYPRVQIHLLVFLGFLFFTVAVPAVFMLVYWFALQLIGGLGSLGTDRGGVAFWAHTGGFLAGAMLVGVFKNPRLLRRNPNYGWSAAPSSRSWRRF